MRRAKRKQTDFRRSASNGEQPLAHFVALACGLAGWPVPQAEYRFHPVRRWRIDFAWVERKLALEVEGGVWVVGRHNHPVGFMRDIEKYNELAVMGWRLIRLMPSQIRKVEVLHDLLVRMIESDRADVSG